MDSLEPHSDEAMETYQQRSRPGRTTAPTLREQVLAPVNWPTPDSQNFNDGEDLVQFKERQTWLKLNKKNGNGMGMPIAVAVRNWNTPTTLLSSIRSSEGMKNTLAGDVANWSTPTASPNANRTLRQKPSNATGKHGGHLTAEVLNWGTPTASTTAKGTTVHSEMLAHGHLVAQVEEFADTQKEHHRLNPDWEETLMGWPVGWSDATKPCVGIFPGFPMGQGYEQYAYEPARTVHKDHSLGRTKRIGMIGNGVVPQQAELAFYLLFRLGVVA